MARVLALVLVVAAVGGCQRKEEPDYTAAERLALAQEQGGLDPWSETAFGYSDDNQDGKVTLDEFRAASMRFFARRDRNGDMVLDPDERFRRPGQPTQGPPPERLTAVEFHAGLEKRFRAGDVNGDGVLDRPEWGELPPISPRGEGPPKASGTGTGAASG